MEMKMLLRMMADNKASDLFISAHCAPSLKIKGVLKSVGNESLTEQQSKELVYGCMIPEQIFEFETTLECNFGLEEDGLGRFRVSAFKQRGYVGMVVRRIETYIPTIEELNLPNILKKLVLLNRGLVLIVGATGCGKTTSLASMLGYRNTHGTGHIVSIEDPIEYLHEHGSCIITQREVGLDTKSYEVGLKNTLRQAPNVVLIGEIRDQSTMAHAISFSETGHLCMSSLHAANASQALDRILSFFPEQKHKQLLTDLSLNLQAIVAQRLIPTKDKSGYYPAIEILLNTPLVAEHIQKGEIHALADVVRSSEQYGMISFDQHLVRLCRRDIISEQSALKYAESENDVRIELMRDVAVDHAQPNSRLAGVTLLDL